MTHHVTLLVSKLNLVFIKCDVCVSVFLNPKSERKVIAVVFIKRHCELLKFLALVLGDSYNNFECWWQKVIYWETYLPHCQ